LESREEKGKKGEGEKNSNGGGDREGGKKTIL